MGLKTKDLGHPEYVIGIHVQKKRKDGSIVLNKKLYIETILRRFEMQDTHGVPTPADPNVKLSKKLEAQTQTDDEKAKMANRPYRALVGALLYVLLTRSDCAVAVNELARYLNNPGPSMWTAAKRVLRYLKATIDHCILLKSFARGRINGKTVAFVDSSHAGDKDTRRSRCGHLIYYNRSPINWKTILQKRVALSTAETEFRAVTLASKDILWLRNLLHEIDRSPCKPTLIYEDNSACIKMVENPVVSGKNKFVELNIHFVRDHDHWSRPKTNLHERLSERYPHARSTG